MSSAPFTGSYTTQLIVLDIDANGVATVLPVSLPVIADTIFYKFKVLIQERFSLTEGRRMNAFDRQSAAEVVPVSRGGARREHFTEHRNVFIGVENLAQDIGAGSLSADHHKELTSWDKDIGIVVRQGFSQAAAVAATKAS
jgi:hypothetical protein